MKKMFLAVSLNLLSMSVSAQAIAAQRAVSFSYDLNGNIVSRKVMPLPSKPIDGNTKIDISGDISIIGKDNKFTIDLKKDYNSTAKFQVNDLSPVVVRDSLGVCMQYGFLKSDTTLMRKALNISDSLLLVEKDKNALRICYKNRSAIFFFLGDGHNAMKSMYLSVRDLPETNINKMNYNLLKSYACNNSDSITFYLKRNINICDSILNKSFINEYAYVKIQYVYYLYGSQQAKKCMENLNKKHHNSLFRNTLNNWNCFCVQLDKEREKIMKIYY